MYRALFAFDIRLLLAQSLISQQGIRFSGARSSVTFIKWYFGYGVPAFFVVSGFSMAYGYMGKLSSSSAVRHYFLRRYTRIAPLFYFVLAFQLLQLRLFYNSTLPVADVFLNAIFAFNPIPHLTDGIVPASWSIGVEMLFYVLFPILILFGSTLIRAAFLTIVSVIMASEFSIDMKPIHENTGFIYHNLLANLPYFFWGIVGYYCFTAAHKIQRHNLRRISAWAICGTAFTLMIALHSDIGFYMAFFSRGLRALWETLWGIPFALLCVGLSIHPIKVLSNGFSRYMGKISYSLYLVHPNVVYYLWKSGVYAAIANALPKVIWFTFIACAAITLAVVTVIASVTYRYIELPGMSLGKRLTKLEVVERQATGR